MAVYIDRLRNHGWVHGKSCHLIADSNEELHAFAASIGMLRDWFQKGSMPHYDLTEKKRAAALAAGAIELDDKTFIGMKKAWRQAAIRRFAAAMSEEEADLIRLHLYR
jgi:hypothetical protein